MRRCLTWQGFDEYMNLVLDEAEEMSIKKKSRKPLGELLPRTQEGRSRTDQSRHPLGKKRTRRYPRMPHSAVQQSRRQHFPSGPPLSPPNANLTPPIALQLPPSTGTTVRQTDTGCAGSTVAHRPARCVGREDSAQGGQHYADDERRAPRGLRPHRTGSRLVASPSSKAQLAALCFSESVRCVDPV